MAQRGVEWCPRALAPVLDVVGVVHAPAPSPVRAVDPMAGLRAEQILGKEAVLKLQLSGEGLAVTDW